MDRIDLTDEAYNRAGNPRKAKFKIISQVNGGKRTWRVFELMQHEITDEHVRHQTLSRFQDLRFKTFEQATAYAVAAVTWARVSSPIDDPPWFM